MLSSMTDWYRWHQECFLFLYFHLVTKTQYLNRWDKSKKLGAGKWKNLSTTWEEYFLLSKIVLKVFMLHWHLYFRKTRKNYMDLWLLIFSGTPNLKIGLIWAIFSALRKALDASYISKKYWKGSCSTKKHLSMTLKLISS